MPYKDPEKQKQAQHDSYLRNKDAVRSASVEDRRVKMAQVNEYKLARGCARCGYDRCVAALEAHHHGGDKTDTVARMCRRGFAWVKILAELEKCEIVCANCHREEHWADVSARLRA